MIKIIEKNSNKNMFIQKRYLIMNDFLSIADPAKKDNIFQISIALDLFVLFPADIWDTGLRYI